MAWAADAIRQDRWIHTSRLIAGMYGAMGVTRDPNEFDPYARQRERERERQLPKVGVEFLKAMWIDGRQGERGAP